MIALKVNGKTHEVDAEPDTPLLWVLRDFLGYTGTKYGCGISYCGACTVQIEGNPIRSCSLPISAVKDKDVKTIEGLENNAVQQAWIAHDVPQCGYCQSGMIMTATTLLQKNPTPSDDDIDEAMTNVCRCGTYTRVRAAIHTAAATIKKGGATV